MKKGILILLGMFMMVSTVEAKEGIESPITVGVYDNYYNNAVSFFERGIQFHIFLNGDFDYDIHRNNSYYNYNVRRTQRNSVRINRDFRGRINKIGSTRIYYDFRGNVRRIGTVSMRYRNGYLTRVGALKITYNRWREAFFYGQVRQTNFYTDSYGVNINLNIGDVCDYNDPYFFRNDFRNNYSQVREDNNFYYYKAKANAKTGKRSTILKRRKPATKRKTKKAVRKSVNNKYKRDNVYKKSNRTLNKKPVTKRANKKVVKKEQNITLKRNATYKKRSAVNKKVRTKRN
jgi:hypothetical protein